MYCSQVDPASTEDNEPVPFPRSAVFSNPLNKRLLKSISSMANPRAEGAKGPRVEASQCIRHNPSPFSSSCDSVSSPSREGYL
jgi:hypothetical protein